MAIKQMGFSIFAGLSSDTKPDTIKTEEAGITFYETDTKKSFIFDGTNGTWEETASQNNIIMYLGVLKGEVTTSTTTPISPVDGDYYIAKTADTYANFGNVVVAKAGDLIIWDGAHWITRPASQLQHNADGTVSSQGSSITAINAAGGKTLTTKEFVLSSSIGAMIYQGSWDVATNDTTPGTPPVTPLPTPSADPVAGNKGHFYIVSVAGDINLPKSDGTPETNKTTFAAGDWAVSDGEKWDKIATSNLVASVFGRTGVIVAKSTDYDAFYEGILSAPTKDNMILSSKKDKTKSWVDLPKNYHEQSTIKYYVTDSGTSSSGKLGIIFPDKTHKEFDILPSPGFGRAFSVIYEKDTLYVVGNYTSTIIPAQVHKFTEFKISKDKKVFFETHVMTKMKSSAHGAGYEQQSITSAPDDELFIYTTDYANKSAYGIGWINKDTMEYGYKKLGTRTGGSTYIAYPYDGFIYTSYGYASSAGNHDIILNQLNPINSEVKELFNGKLPDNNNMYYNRMVIYKGLIYITNQISPGNGTVVAIYEFSLAGKHLRTFNIISHGVSMTKGILGYNDFLFIFGNNKIIKLNLKTTVITEIYVGAITSMTNEDVKLTEGGDIFFGVAGGYKIINSDGIVLDRYSGLPTSASTGFWIKPYDGTTREIYGTTVESIGLSTYVTKNPLKTATDVGYIISQDRRDNKSIEIGNRSIDMTYGGTHTTLGERSVSVGGENIGTSKTAKRTVVLGGKDVLGTQPDMVYLSGIKYKSYATVEIAALPNSELGTFLFDSTLNSLVQCTDATAGANVWKPIGGSGTGALFQFNYQWKFAVDADPPTNYMSRDNAVTASITKLYVNKVDATGHDMSLFLSEITAGDDLTLHDHNDADIYIVFTVSAAVTLTGNAFTIPVTFVKQNGHDFTDNENVNIHWVSESIDIVPQTQPTAPSTLLGTVSLTEMNAILDYSKSISNALKASGVFKV